MVGWFFREGLTVVRHILADLVASAFMMAAALLFMKARLRIKAREPQGILFVIIWLVCIFFAFHLQP